MELPRGSADAAAIPGCCPVLQVYPLCFGLAETWTVTGADLKQPDPDRVALDADPRVTRCLDFVLPGTWHLARQPYLPLWRDGLRKEQAKAWMRNLTLPTGLGTARWTQHVCNVFPVAGPEFIRGPGPGCIKLTCSRAMRTVSRRGRTRRLGRRSSGSTCPGVGTSTGTTMRTSVCWRSGRSPRPARTIAVSANPKSLPGDCQLPVLGPDLTLQPEQDWGY